MAATDATPIPVKGQACRVTFPILDADGDLVTAATGLDSEVSKDGATFADCTNEATEIATGSGMYFLDLTATEMNADTVAVVVKTTSSGAKTTPMIMYPNKAGGLAVNVTAWAGNTTTTGDIAIKTTLAKTTHITGFNDVSTAQVNTECDTALSDVGVTTTVTGRIDAAVSTRATPAQVQTELGTYGALKPTTAGRTLDVTTGGEAGIDLDNTAGTLAKGTDITGFNDLSAANVQTELATYGALKPTVAARTLDVSATGEAGIDWANVGAPTTTVALTGTTVGLTPAAIDSVWAKTMTELAAVPGVTASVLSALQWIFLLSRNKITQTATTQLVRNDADSATIGTSTVSDDGTTFTRGKLT